MAINTTVKAGGSKVSARVLQYTANVHCSSSMHIYQQDSEWQRQATGKLHTHEFRHNSTEKIIQQQQRIIQQQQSFNQETQRRMQESRMRQQAAERQTREAQLRTQRANEMARRAIVAQAQRMNQMMQHEMQFERRIMSHQR